VNQYQAVRMVLRRMESDTQGPTTSELAAVNDYVLRRYGFAASALPTSLTMLIAKLASEISYLEENR
jgi:hypothetical protein